MSCAPAHPPWWFCSRLRQHSDTAPAVGLVAQGREEEMFPWPADSAPAPSPKVWLALCDEKRDVVEW